MTSPEKIPSQVRDGMRIEWDVPIVYGRRHHAARRYSPRPVAEGRYPAIMTDGALRQRPGIRAGLQDRLGKILEKDYPDAVAWKLQEYQAWEVPDPEKWVPDGYVCIVSTARRPLAGASLMSTGRVRRSHDCIEWAAAQPWCRGRSASAWITTRPTSGVSRAPQPPHLGALCVWEDSPST